MKSKRLLEQILSKKKRYLKFKYQEEIYKLGDCLMIQDQGGRYSVAKLLEIIPRNGIKKHSLWPTIKVQWFYSKADINREKNSLIALKDFNSISDYELFNSLHTDTIYIETVVCKCIVVHMEEYLKLDEPSELVYFYRADYDPIKEVLKPPFEKWNKICKCNTPFNPDQLYLKCDNCMKYFHPTCVGIPEEKGEQMDAFYCNECISSINPKTDLKENSNIYRNLNPKTTVVITKDKSH